RQKRTKISRQLISGRYGCTSGASKALKDAFPAAEEEQLVADDRPTDREAVDVPLAARLVCLTVPIDIKVVEEITSIQNTVLVLTEQRTTEVVRSRLGHNCNRRSTGKPLLGIKVISRNVSDFNGLCWRHIRIVVR